MDKKILLCPWKKLKVVSEPETNLSLSITGVDDFAEWNNTEYTASLTLSWVIGSPNTVLTVTLPAWITYVSSSDSGSESGWVITWTLGDLIANKSVTFTINSDTPAPVYTVTGQVVSDFGNLWTATASKDIEVTEPVSVGIEIRWFIDWVWEFDVWEIWAILSVTLDGGNVASSFTYDKLFLSTGNFRLWYLDWGVTSWTLVIRMIFYWDPRIWTISYVQADPTVINFNPE